LEAAMVRTYSEQQRNEALAAIAADADILELAETMGIPLKTLFRWFAEQAGCRTSHGGRKPTLNDSDLKVLRELLETSRRWTLAELAAAFAERTSKTVSESVISKGMKKLGFRKYKLLKAPSVPAPQTPPRYTEAHRREPTLTSYPSDLTDAEWAVLQPLLERKGKRGRPATIDKRLLLNAIFYQSRTGCQWRYLPKDFPRWEAVWSLFRRWRDSGKFAQIYDALHGQARLAAGRNLEPSAGIVDSQTVKSTEKGGLAATTRARKPRGANGTWSSIPLDFQAQF